MAVNIPGGSSSGGSTVLGSPAGTDWIVGYTEWTHNEVHPNGTQIWDMAPFATDYVSVGTGISNYHRNSTTDTGTFGVHQWVMGSTSGSYGSMTTDIESMNTGVGTWRTGIRIMIEDIPDSGGEDYYILTGFNSLASYRATGQYALLGIDLTDNATNFIVQTHGGSSETVTDTGVAFAADTWYTLEVEMNATSVSAWIDGVKVLDASTSNVPVAATTMGASLCLHRRIGSPAAVRNFYTDWGYIAFKPGAAREALGSGNPWAAGVGNPNGESNTASSVGSGTSIVSAKSGVDLEMKSLNAGDGVAITSDSTDITIAAPSSANGSADVHPGNWTNWRHFLADLTKVYTISGLSSAFTATGSGAYIIFERALTTGDELGVLAISSISSYGALTSGLKSIQADGSEVRAYFRMRLPTVPDGTDDFYCTFGFHEDSVSRVTTNSDGAIIYIDLTDSATNWMIRSGTSVSLATPTDTGVAFATDGSWENIEIRKNSGGTSYTYYINGTLVHTETSSVPDAASEMAIVSSNWGTLGANGLHELCFAGYSIKHDTAWTWGTW